MNATLWVIWSAVTIAALFAGLAIGSHFPARHLLDAKYWDGRRDEAKVVDRFREQALDRAWREGYEKGCNDELASCAPCEHEPLARGAGAPSSGTNSTPVTTAPWSGDSATALKGDSPGPGLPPVDCHWPDCSDSGACDYRGQQCAADIMFIPANPAPIFDALSAGWPQLATPPTSPPGGVAPEPPAPVRDSSPHSDEGPREGFDSPVAAGAGAGADPWQEIVAANQEVWEPFTDTDVFRRISGDLDALRSALSAPVQLPPWKDSQ